MVDQHQRHEAAGDDIAPPEQRRIDAAVDEDEPLERDLPREVGVGQVVDEREVEDAGDEEAEQVAHAALRRRPAASRPVHA